MIIVCNLSINIVDFVQFRRTFQMTRRDVSLSHRTKLAYSIVDRALQIRTTLLKNLSFKRKVAISLDDWTSSNNKTFMTIVCFYFIDSWDYRRKLLTFNEIKENHSDQNLALMLTQVFRDYNILNRISIITTDNVSNNNIMIEKIVKTTNSLFSRISRVSCLAHVILLFVKTLLNTLTICLNNEAEDTIWEIKVSIQNYSKQTRFARTLFKIRLYSLFCNLFCNQLLTWLWLIKIDTKTSCIFKCKLAKRKVVLRYSTIA